MNTKTTLLLSALIFCLAALPAQENNKSQSYVAKVGDVFISEREFVHRFEMLPAFGRHQRANLEYNKAEFLYTLIAEKLLAQEAMARNFDRDTVFQNALHVIRKKLSRDELYRAEVIRKVKLTDLEIIRGIARSQTLLFTSYIFFPNEKDARFVRSLMKKPSDFESLKIDSSIAYLRDTATVIWGDADPALENAVYALKNNDISSVIKAGEGFYIAKVNSIETNKYFSSMQKKDLNAKVVETLRLRKERERLDEYVAEVLKDKQGYSLPKSFVLLAHALKDAYCDPTKKYSGLFFSDVMMQVRMKCAAHLEDSLVVVGNSVWSVDEVISKLTNKVIKNERVDSMQIPGILNTNIQVLVQQELLEQEALRRGLDQEPAVKEKLERWRDAMLASTMKEYVRKNVSVTEAEIYSQMKTQAPQTSIPHVQIRLLKTASLEEMNSAMDEIKQGMEFTQAVALWSMDTVTKQNYGLLDYFPITERHPLGEIAWRMDVGETYGPISYEGGYLYFELTGKKNIPAKNDTVFASQYQKAKANLLNLRAKRTLDQFLAQTGEKRGFAIYEDRFKQIKVTPIPMMTFRILGFGGKMFEVPFVDRQLDWLDVEPPKTNVIP